MKQVTYSEKNVPISSGWICIGEYAPSNPNTSVFGQCSSEMLLGTQMQQYSYHGLNAYANQNMFQTGPSSHPVSISEQGEQQDISDLLTPGYFSLRSRYGIRYCR